VGREDRWFDAAKVFAWVSVASVAYLVAWIVIIVYGAGFELFSSFSCVESQPPPPPPPPLPGAPALPPAEHLFALDKFCLSDELTERLNSVVMVVMPVIALIFLPLCSIGSACAVAFGWRPERKRSAEREARIAGAEKLEAKTTS